MMQLDKEYAAALFQLAVEEDACESYLQGLHQVQMAVMESPEYMEFLASPAIPLGERLGAIEEAFGKALPEHLVSFLKLLCENGRIRILVDCIKEFGRLVMAQSGRVAATVTSAIALSQEQQEALCQKLSKMTGKEIDPIYVVDPSLIGGLKIDIEGKTYDGSLKSRLRDVKDVISG